MPPSTSRAATVCGWSRNNAYRSGKTKRRCFPTGEQRRLFGQKNGGWNGNSDTVLQFEDIHAVVPGIHVDIPAVVHYAVFGGGQHGTRDGDVEEEFLGIRRDEVGQLLDIVCLLYTSDAADE